MIGKKKKRREKERRKRHKNIGHYKEMKWKVIEKQKQVN
jgi:hypothetical protein